jgi:class 3 adenylate cyclase
MRGAPRSALSVVREMWASPLKFCRSCGASLVGARPAESVADAVARKIVTIVFADLIGSTALHERLDAESVRRFMDRYYGAMRSSVEAHGGTVTQLLGDGVMAVFGAPRVAEDDAIRAVRAAVGMQRAFRELAREQMDVVGRTGLRVAINTGGVVAKDTSAVRRDPPRGTSARPCRRDRPLGGVDDGASRRRSRRPGLRTRRPGSTIRCWGPGPLPSATARRWSASTS